MNIALIAWDEVRAGFLTGIADKLAKSGHNTRMFLRFGGRFDKDCHWDEFRGIKQILAFKPEKVIIFNGFARETNPATHLLQHYFGKNMFFVEQGWLPQAGNVYIDNLGLGARSSLYSDKRPLFPNESISESEMAFMNGQLLGSYGMRAEAESASPHEKKILVVLQMEKDTSILYDSPFFKTNKALLNWVHWSISDVERVSVSIRPHPRCDDSASVALNHQLINAGEQHRISDPKKESFKDAILSSNLVVGINSTSLMEAAAIFNRPVICLGKNISSNPDNSVFLRSESKALTTKITDRDFEPLPKQLKKNTLNERIFLLQNQFPKNDVPDWVVSYVETGVKPDKR